MIAPVLAVGVVAAVDLRRLQTPHGTALAWTGAAIFGDCTLSGAVAATVAGTAQRRVALLRFDAAWSRSSGSCA